MIVLSLFDGMSCGQIALGNQVSKYYASEIDPYAIKVTQKNYPETAQLGDVSKWREWDLDWSSIDLLIGGSPCQGFSLVGKQLSFDDPRSRLFFEYVDILNHLKEVNPQVQFLLENVRMKSADMDVITHYLGVQSVAINSNLMVPQSRPRWYWANWTITPPVQQPTSHMEIVDDPTLLPATVRKGDPRPIKFTGNQFLCLTATYYKGIRADGRPALSRREGEFDEVRAAGDCRMLTPMECERLQGIPDGYTEGVSNTQRYKMIGNGWTVPVIRHILNQREVPYEQLTTCHHGEELKE